MGASIARKLTRLGPRVLRHQLAQVCASSCLMTCFFMCRDSLSILKACSYIFYLLCASRSHGTLNSAVPDHNVWCCTLLFLCTLGLEKIRFCNLPLFFLLHSHFQYLNSQPTSPQHGFGTVLTTEKSVISGQQEVEHVEEHLVIIGCTNNVPAPSLFSNSSEVDTRNGWLLKIFGRNCPSSVKQ